MKTAKQTPTRRQRAESLLEIHMGQCFVMEGSKLVAPFRDMEREKLVTITRSFEGIPGIVIRAKYE